MEEKQKESVEAGTSRLNTFQILPNIESVAVHTQVTCHLLWQWKNRMGFESSELPVAWDQSCYLVPTTW